MWHSPDRLLIQLVKHLLGYRAVTDGVQDVFESAIFLPENLNQFIALKPCIAPDVGIEEPEALVVFAHVCDLVRLARRHRSKLVWVSKHHNLSTTKRHLALASSNTHRAADGIHGVCVHHRNLVDNQEVDGGKNLTRVASHLLAKINVMQQVEVKAEERVDGSTVHVQSRDAGWCHNGNRLVGVLNQVVEQSRLSGAGATCDEDVSFG